PAPRGAPRRPAPPSRRRTPPPTGRAGRWCTSRPDPWPGRRTGARRGPPPGRGPGRSPRPPVPRTASPDPPAHGPWGHLGVTSDPDRLNGLGAAETPTVPCADDATGCTIWLKLEYQLPSGSTKDRLAAHVLSRAVADGRVHAGT